MPRIQNTLPCLLMLALGPGFFGIANAQTPIIEEAAKLIADEPTKADRFGWTVAADGDTVVIGVYRDDDKSEDSGSAYVFSETAPARGVSRQS